MNHLVILIHVGSAADEQLQNVYVTVGRREQQRRLAVIAPAGYAGIVLEQQPAGGQLSVVRGPDQRRKAVRISLIQRVQIVLDVLLTELALCGQLVDRSLSQVRSALLSLDVAPLEVCQNS